LLIEEARWLGEQLSALDPERVFPLLDVGSSTRSFRTQEQPWIDELIFAPARAAGRTVSHLDAKSAEGVDIVTDLSDRQAISVLAARGFRSILCSNLLEHVVDRAQIASALLEIIPAGGYLFVSGPYRYPRHSDPFDSMFRPTPVELAGLFPLTRLHAQAVVKDGNYFDEIRRRPVGFIRLLVRLLLPFYRPSVWRQEAIQLGRYLPWMFRRFEASCVVLVRER
jgi:hypothetical protein